MQKQISFREARTDLKSHIEKINQNRHPITLLLDRLTDVSNIGLLFRLADAARINKVILYKMPNFEPTPKIERISRSTINYVAYEKIITDGTLNILKKTHELVALEYTNQSILHTDWMPTRPVILMIGNERFGLSQELLDLSHQSIHIPMYGINTSLNVAMATGIAVFSMVKKITDGEPQVDL